MAIGKRSPLGKNPLSQGIFSKTDLAGEGKARLSQETVSEETEPTSATQKKESRKKNHDYGKKNPEQRIQKKESAFLQVGDRENVNFRLPAELNDWLDDLLKSGKRKHGRKIPKEIWVQAALELLRAMPVDWPEVGSEEGLRQQLLMLESRIKNQEN